MHAINSELVTCVGGPIILTATGNADTSLQARIASSVHQALLVKPKLQTFADAIAGDGGGDGDAIAGLGMMVMIVVVCMLLVFPTHLK